MNIAELGAIDGANGQWPKLHVHCVEGCSPTCCFSSVFGEVPLFEPLAEEIASSMPGMDVCDSRTGRSVVAA